MQTSMPPRRGVLGYAAGFPGFYVVNPQTNIAVSVYPTHAGAQADADRRNAAYPFDPVNLEVVEVHDGD